MLDVNGPPDGLAPNLHQMTPAMLNGKGWFIWQVSRCEQGRASAIADKAAAAGLTHVLIKVADRHYAYGLDWLGRDLVAPVAEALRARGVQVPVVFLTARDALVDRLAGFDAGGDDYITKPFAFAELVARIQALLRRAAAEPAAPDGRAPFFLDPVNRSIGGDAPQGLTPIEYRLLARLLAAPGEAVRRRDLIRAGWTHGARVSDNSLDAYVARLRRKLASIPDAPEITTVHGLGYRLG
jgi:two-component system OmpR family response regulator